MAGRDLCDEPTARVVGAVLAGGRGARIGGAKALAAPGGVTLAERAVALLRQVADDVVVVARAETPLPALGVEVWHDDAAPGDLHPRHGLVRAGRGAGAARVLALAVDLPLVSPALLRALLGAGPTAVARAGGRIQPLCGVYAPEALAALAGVPPDEALTASVLRLAPALVDAPEAELLNVNTEHDLSVAAARLGGSGG